MKTFLNKLSTKIVNIKDAMLLNYKTWILYFICSSIICDYNMILGIITFLYTYYVSYMGHKLLHVDAFYTNIYAISHGYHHINSGTFSVIISAMTEFLTLTNNIMAKYLYDQFHLWDLFFINEWMILFVYLLYTTTHNINYSIFRVNNYHAKHHQIYDTNIGPDFFDLIFDTKSKETPESELIDHFIPNIIGSFIIVIAFKYFYNNLHIDDKGVCKGIFAFKWLFCSFVLTLSACKILYYQINDNIDNNVMRYI